MKSEIKENVSLKQENPQNASKHEEKVVPGGTEHKTRRAKKLAQEPALVQEHKARGDHSMGLEVEQGNRQPGRPEEEQLQQQTWHTLVE